MSYDVILAKKAIKELGKLEKPVSKRILKKIKELQFQDEPLIEKVKNQNFYKFRVGDYRAFIDKYPLRKKLVVTEIRHRKKAYKNL